MQWKPPSIELGQLLQEALKDFKVTPKKMFGCPVYFVNGNMFAGVHQDSLMVRLSDQDREELLAQCDEAAIFEPMPGRKMREYVVLPESLSADRHTFINWLQRSYKYASSLPPKESKAEKRKKTA
jgi:TfoX/Sxy family transcriptional regulator of competence genes